MSRYNKQRNYYFNLLHLTKQKYYDSLDIGRITVNKAICKIKNSLFQVKVSTNSRIKGDIFSEK